MKKLKNAPHLKEPWNNQPHSDLLILAGARAWEVWSKGEGIEWRMIADGLQIEPFKSASGEQVARYAQKPVILGDDQLASLEQLKIAHQQQRYIKLIQCGELSEAQKTALALNIAQTTEASHVALIDSVTLERLEDWSGYIQRLRNDERTAELAQQSAQKAPQSDLSEEQAKNQPYIEKRTVSDLRGLYRITPKYDNNTGDLISEREEWLCDVVEVVGIGRSETEDFIVLEWQPENSAHKVIEALPLGDLGEREGWRQLRKRGLNLTNKSHLRSELADYLQNIDKGNRQLWTVTNATGWQNGAYILPNGEIIGQPESPVLFRSQSASFSGYAISGTLESWRAEVADYVKGNPSMMLGVAVALSAPMVSLLGAESFGVHLFEDSSRGKTTAGNIASSIYGHPDRTRLSWNTTALGISNEAAAHNDGFLVIDEIGQIANPKHAEQIAYTLFNGVGKIQGAREGGNRELQRWNITALSSGEKDLETTLKEKGIKINAGQLVRLLNIPFEPAQAFHSFANAKTHADHLNQATRAHYGAVGREWINLLLENRQKVTALYSELKAKWVNRPPTDADPQVLRVAGRFAILETALQLAHELTGWSATDNSESLIHCFNLWVNAFGFQSKKETMLIEQVNGWLLRYGARFIEVPLNPNQKEPSDCAGYKLLLSEHNDKERFLIYPQVYLEDVIAGHSEKQANEILFKAGMLEKSSEEPPRFRVKTAASIDKKRTRCYVLIPISEE